MKKKTAANDEDDVKADTRTVRGGSATTRRRPRISGKQTR